MKMKVEKLRDNQARITITYADGRRQIRIETDALKANAMTTAYEAAGKLGVEIDLPPWAGS